MEEVAVYGIGALALLTAFIVQELVSVRSAKRGDGALLVWTKSGCAGGFAMIGFVALLLVIANLISWIGA